MTISATGAISFSDIQAEMGGSGAVSMSDYYSVSAGLPASGVITFDDFRGEQFDVLDIVTSSTTYNPRANAATYVHLIVVAAGASGGSSEIDTSGLTTGVAASSGGGAGAVVHHRLASADFTGGYTITVGTGGVGVTSAGDSGLNGNAGGNTTVTGANAALTANGGAAGQGRANSGGGTDVSNAPAAAGGTATGGNQDNWTGGASGSAVTTGDKTGCASGGGAPVMSASDYDGTDATNTQATAGGILSTKNDLPDVIATYLTNRDQALTLTDFDASAGVYNASSGGSDTPTYGAGSGGACHNAGRASGNGGDGVVLVIYEVT